MLVRSLRFDVDVVGGRLLSVLGGLSWLLRLRLCLIFGRGCGCTEGVGIWSWLDCASG